MDHEIWVYRVAIARFGIQSDVYTVQLPGGYAIRHDTFIVEMK